MKKVIDRVNAGFSDASTTDKKKGWGLSGAVKKATGIGSAKRPEKDASADGEDAPSGLRVDQCECGFDFM